MSEAVGLDEFEPTALAFGDSRRAVGILKTMETTSTPVRVMPVSAAKSFNAVNRISQSAGPRRRMREGIQDHEHRPKESKDILGPNRQERGDLHRQVEGNAGSDQEAKPAAVPGLQS
ncbi:hypothetical protein ACG04R_23240 [Roseateles sp. BYS78W]|uniref:Uncharacterized protein n=1 Tax=Pelomonas candidula TaxID=3299025 RepID=A0ABW7HIC0_9BURK